MYNWSNYINQQRYSECYVISIINAYYYFTGEIIEQYSEEYEYLVDSALARSGAALEIAKVYDYLGLVVVESFKTLPKFTDLICPLEVIVWHKHIGFHSVLIVDKLLEGKQLQITNFMQATDDQGLIGYYDFKKYVVKHSHCGVPVKLLGMKEPKFEI